jgi:hypothetical protein
LWRQLYCLTSYNDIYDSDVEEHINAALSTAGVEWDHSLGLHIYSGHWPGVKSVAIAMVAKHLELGWFNPCPDALLRGALMHMSRVLGWNFGEDEDEESGDEMAVKS